MADETWLSSFLLPMGMPHWAVQILADSFLHFSMIPSLALTVPRYPSPVPFFSLGSLGVPFTECQAKLPLPLSFSLFLKPRAYPFMGLGFLLPILNGPWLTDWAFLIFEVLFALDLDTCNILILINHSPIHSSQKVNL